MKPVWLPLQGEGGERPKAPAVNGWQSPTYEGVEPDGDWVGLRTDGLVVIDCDNDAAARAWRAIDTSQDVCVRKTPRGYHFIYRQTPDSPDGPRVGVMPGVDIRAGRTSQIVFNAPGYRWVQGDLDSLTPFRPVWLPKRSTAEVAPEDEWTEMPQGRGNNTMTAIAGALRRQGMAMETIYATLKGINRLTMTEDPMPDEMIQQIAQSVSRYEPNPDLVVADDDDEPEEVTHEKIAEEYLDARNMELPPPPEWLWKPYLPKGRLIMVDGQEGIGKGMFAVWAACKVVSGSAFPGGKAHPPAPVVWFTAEDDPEEDILRRLLAAGYSQAAHAPIFFRDPRVVKLKFPVDIRELRNICRRLKPGLVVMDPGRSFLGPENDKVEMSFNNEAALRPGLEAMMWVAHDTNTTIMFVHHWNKMSQGTTRDKMGGSGAFLQVVRHRVSLAEQHGMCALSVEKSNVIDKQHTVRSYEVVEVPKFDTAKLEMGGALADFRNLDEWIEYTQKLGGEDVVIETIIDAAEVAWHYKFLEPGSPAPTVKDISRDMDITTEEAQKIRSQLVAQGVIGGSSGNTNRWYGQPVANHGRTE